MKGFAIASLVLGIIGLLSSFSFGLGILPSTLAVGLGIFPSLIRGSRAMGITGLVLGLLGFFISNTIIHHPEIYVRAMLGLPAKEESTRNTEEKSTQTNIKLGESMRIGDFLITFGSAEITNIYKQKYYSPTAKPNYKFVAINITGKNVGKRANFIYSSKNEIEVDKGYFYNPKLGNLSLSLLPEEEKSEELVFEILEDTEPIKLHIVILGNQYTVDIAGAGESN